MAEAVVSFAIERIGELLIQEAVFLHGVSEEAESLQAELKRMQCFLKDADLKQERDERVRNWVAEIRDVAYDAEDVIDTYILQVAARFRERGFNGVLKRAASIFTKCYCRYKIGKQIKSICTKIDGISKSMQTYGIQFASEGAGSNSISEMQRQLRRSYPHTEEEVVSLEYSTRDLIAQLMIEEEQLRVVSIVGMGGLGKTTLAKEVYNRVDVKRHFDCYAWGFISQQFTTRDVLQVVLTKVTGDERYAHGGMREEVLVEKLHNVLRERRYLVVLDDIWRNEAWDILKHAFPNGKKGSKVLFTTRNREVALHANPWSSPIEPPFLKDDESWELLCKKLQKDAVGNCCSLPEFEKLGREMARKCGGLPLAIVVLGGLLATKNSLSEWKAVQRNINAHLNDYKQQQHQHYGGVNGILALSYLELPYYLKPCFLYLGHFPEDWEIHRSILIKLWIAEGFVPSPLEGEREGMMEDVAARYLDELISRCMVQVDRMSSTGRGVKTCRIHDLMRDFCVKKAREENFLGIAQQRQNVIAYDSSVESRRIAIHHMYSHEGLDRYVPTRGCAHLRTLLFSGKEGIVLEKWQQISTFKEFKLLRVLNLGSVDVKGSSLVFKECAKLIHLRYLKLYSSQALTVIRAIGNLRSLRILFIQSSWGLTLPSEMSKLENLRHLFLDNLPYEQIKGHYRVDTLRNLVSLKYINAENLIRNDALKKLANLRKLGIKFNTSEEVTVLLLSPVVELDCLRSLEMEMVSGDPFPNLESISKSQHLSKLTLSGIMQEDLHSHHALQFLPANLTKLILRNSELERDPMSILEKLPNLRFLCLWRNAYRGSKMVCSAQGFPKLEILQLHELEEVEDWEVEEDAMPCLRSLEIYDVRKLRMIPEGLRFVTTLRELTVVGKNGTFVNRLQVVNGLEGEDFYKVRHVPSVNARLWQW